MISPGAHEAWGAGYRDGRESELGYVLAHLDRIRSEGDSADLRKFRGELEKRLHRQKPSVDADVLAAQYVAKTGSDLQDARKREMDEAARVARSQRPGNRVVQFFRSLRDTSVDAWKRRKS